MTKPFEEGMRRLAHALGILTASVVVFFGLLGGLHRGWTLFLVYAPFSYFGGWAFVKIGTWVLRGFNDNAQVIAPNENVSAKTHLNPPASWRDYTRTALNVFIILVIFIALVLFVASFHKNPGFAARTVTDGFISNILNPIAWLVLSIVAASTPRKTIAYPTLFGASFALELILLQTRTMNPGQWLIGSFFGYVLCDMAFGLAVHTYLRRNKINPKEVSNGPN